MKVSFITGRADLMNKLHEHGKKVLEHADKTHDGYFMVTVQPRIPEKTLQQLRAFHALLHAAFITGETSYDTEQDWKNALKLRAANPEYYIYLDDNGKQHLVKSMKRIPEGSLYVPVAKSMADFTKGEAMRVLDEILREIAEAGISSPKIDEIISGMESGIGDMY